jgi:hypothetical protein
VIDDNRLPSVAARLRGRFNRAHGEAVEGVIKMRLIASGLVRVARIETGWRVQWRNGRVTGATPIAKVAGDFTAMVPGTGQAVLVEVKHRPGRIRFGDVEPHQRLALDETDQHGGLALLAWSYGIGIELLRWPCLLPGESLTPEDITDDMRWKGCR